ncbi:vacuolar fusion protein CCZ1 homolog [Centruroides sculpturatus]|uniref:vacuolar fusion protein CCZ1 homolog n=1 Tax=Centruroides sculpturatus TaxID=218467 RepID=UPI000C6D4545|nr:vacuolar fusion protein CCZ1 homolog [Centruroides sculpturatus]
MSAKSPISLLNFFVFNSTYGNREGEESRKIIFYYPDKTDLDTRIKNIGLCEAIIKFSDTFATQSSCEVLHTKKTRQLFLQAEKNFWMVMSLSIPFQQKLRDGQLYPDYYAEEVQDHVFQALLKALYKMFRLIMGTFKHNLEHGGIEYLKQKLEIFYLRYLPKIKFHQVDLLDVFQGIQFLPLEKYPFLKIQCFISLTEATFSQIKYTAFLYNDQLVWSGLNQEDMQVLYRFLICHLIPSFLESELQLGAFSPSRPTSFSSGQHFGSYIYRTSSTDQQIKYHYMYFNRLNLAEKSTIHIDARKTGHMSFPPEIIKLLADINFDLSRLTDAGEIIGKTVADCWVIGKLSEQREFYVVLQQKNANIINVSDELKRLNAINFQNIFLVD